MNVYILLSYEFSEKKKKVYLNNIDFFKSEKDLLTHIKANKLELRNEKDSAEEKIITSLINILKKYVSGEKIELYEEIKNLNVDLAIDKKFSTQFSLEVINYLIKVKYNQFTTYSEIGISINSKAFRAIGNIMRKNPLPLIIPCHRVLRKNGEIGGYMGKMDKEWQQKLKMDLLEMEGFKK
ncbi:MAG: methylated-DNA--[protein]-cysteine S-methyltransferase [Promethearchaeota archaeon]